MSFVDFSVPDVARGHGRAIVIVQSDGRTVHGDTVERRGTRS